MYVLISPKICQVSRDAFRVLSRIVGHGVQHFLVTPHKPQPNPFFGKRAGDCRPDSAACACHNCDLVGKHRHWSPFFRWIP
jgi:hypothetical protein